MSHIGKFMSGRYKECLVLTYAPNSGELITPANLQRIDELTERLGARRCTAVT